ncbi:MAG: hypothetical protein U0168_21165 [Nannocystaceae bacterium]
MLIRGVFDKRRLDLLRYFIVFEDDGDTAIKKMAGYHQFHAVARALDATISASPAGRPSRRRGLAHAGVGQESHDGLSTWAASCCTRRCRT